MERNYEKKKAKYAQSSDDEREELKAMIEN
jgi:hypothetical protein